MALEHRTLISSVQRALRIVDIVSGAPRPMPVKAVAQASGLSLGTAYNLTRTLVHEGYLGTEPDGLVLGLRFPSLRDADAGVFLARVRHTLRQVAGENGATAYLARFSDGRVGLIDIVDAAGTPRSEPWTGLSASPYASALGRQILSQLSREQRADFLAAHGRPPGAHAAPGAPDARGIPAAHAAHVAYAANGSNAAHLAGPASVTNAGTAAGTHTATHLYGTVTLPRPADARGTHQGAAHGNACLAVPVRAPGVIAALGVAVIGEWGTAELGALTLRLRASANALAAQLGAERPVQARA
ncbi:MULTISPECIES: helix-turn-helix domain-containing protein [unclassified Cryobacterium]|uniref:helix-turn-helix domain-containing protein n=2 Tax=Cryobacterium TaxID=69578 RepID=UPI002AB5D6B9|nr:MULTISPECIES: helix-turn-helix domain-containing protein [unclassified Cryobacterium]MDY7527069.1 helix-turn-helix domain-containing protein [Cryobacterium sp. 10C2]MEB0003034.1 helix-turn-helix domain-containing protein [Cryobacterium sp. RTC2.1]MEB0287075.1 helix-turn-helix domain-containing protein [Cryobacterium sp. 10S3]MEB0290145.1 helix-turn-helix domain-containing protein [Cryobacterium sp. 10C2]MEB0306277.1 helix-turn-helix domain-containing protein [Cryobacterium sp. 10I1]